MEKLYIYLLCCALGIIIGMTIEWLLVRNRIQTTEITVRKIKQKKTTDSIQDVTNQITEESLTRKELRDQRKQERKTKKALRKQNK